MVGTARVFAPRDVRGHQRIAGVRSTAVSSRPTGHPILNGRKGVLHGIERIARWSPAVGNDRIGGSMERDQRHRSTVRAPARRQGLGGRHQPHGRDAIGERAGQHKRHGSAIGNPVGIDPRRVDVVGRLQRVDQRCDEPHIPHQPCAPAYVPDLGHIASRRVDDKEPLLIGQRVPPAQVPLLGRPPCRGVQADDERRRLGAVVALGDVEQVLPLLARGNDCAVRPIEHVDRRHNGQHQRDWQAEDNQHGADDQLPDLHRRPWR